MDAFEAVGRMLGAFELRQRAAYCRRLARDLDRRGGWLTAHAAALARQHATSYEQRAQWAEESVTEDRASPSTTRSTDANNRTPVDDRA